MAAPQIDLSTSYLGLALPNPIIVGSCGLTRTIEGIEKCAAAGAGALVLKSLFEEQIAAEVEQLATKSEPSFWHPEAADYIQAYGWEDAVGRYLTLIREAKRVASVPIIASIHCVSAGSWIEFAHRVEEAGADALELNIFVMPSDPRRSGEENEQVYFEIIREVRQRVTLPIAVKIGCYFSSLSRMIDRLSQSGVAGLVLFNRFYQPDFDIDKLELKAAPGYSRPEEMYLPLRWIALMSGRVSCDLAASTGVHDGAAVVKQLLAGARAVQVVSALYRQGVQKIGAMRGELQTWMERHGHASIAAFRGQMSQDAADNPAAYERVQFMRMTADRE